MKENNQYLDERMKRILHCKSHKGVVNQQWANNANVFKRNKAFTPGNQICFTIFRYSGIPKEFNQ